MILNIKKVKITDLTRFARVSRTLRSCESCPRYGNSWSCPPDTPSIYRYLRKYRSAYIVCTNVVYPEELTDKSVPDILRKREAYYDSVRRKLQLALLECEKRFPGTYSVSTCLYCPVCARSEGKPCRHPEFMRYSMTTLGLDFSSLMKELFGRQLEWSGEKLSESDMIVAALFEP